MKFTQKTKYFIFGAIATAVLVPLGTYAVKTIPVTFAEGDVVSASVMNALMSRINDTQLGFTADSDLSGAWTCTVTDVANGAPDNDCAQQDGIFYKKSMTVTFDSTAKTYTRSSAFRCSASATKLKGSYGIRGGLLGVTYTNDISVNSFRAVKVTPDTFNVYEDSAVANCVKQSIAPSPADAVTATVSGTSVALTWTDQSTDETGFKVQYKTSAKGSWTTATTTAANATSYTLTGLTAGTYWIRIVAKNTNGDSMSSSEVQAVVPGSYQTCVANC